MSQEVQRSPQGLSTAPAGEVISVEKNGNIHNARHRREVVEMAVRLLEEYLTTGRRFTSEARDMIRRPADYMLVRYHLPRQGSPDIRIRVVLLAGVWGELPVRIARLLRAPHELTETHLAITERLWTPADHRTIKVEVHEDLREELQHLLDLLLI